MKCFSCSKDIAIAIGDLVGRREECPHCGADVHACLNCAHYDKGSYNECKESAADVVKEKDRSNFCDHFTPGNRDGLGGPGKNDLLSAAEALFKKK